MIFRTLRWRMVAAFGFVILITLLLSGGLSLWATTTRFDILVTDEGRAQADTIAPLLEASYALNEGWGGLDELMSGGGEDEGPPADSALWESNVDWFAVVMDELGMDETAFFQAWEELGSIAAIAREKGTTSEVLIDAIMAAELEALPPDVPVEELAWLETAVTDLINDDNQLDVEINWDQIIADTLGVSLSQFYDDWENESIIEQADRHAVDPEELVAAIMQEEQAYVEATMDSATAADAVFYLASSLTFAEEYVYGNDSYLTESNDPSIFGIVTDNLFGNNRALITNMDDIVIYDSEGEMLGEQLDEETLQQATLLWNTAHTTPIGRLLIAVGSGYYNAQQTAFLEGVMLSTAISGVLAALFALAVGWLVARHIAAPVTALTAATAELANGRLHSRLPITSADELGQMSAAFNSMADELDNQQALRKRLVDDISHELHTPLSVIQLELEAMRDGMQSPAQATTQTLQEIALLRQLVDDLSLLTAGEGVMTLALQPVDLAALTSKAVGRWQSQAEAAGVTMTVEPFPPLPLVPADETRLMQALGNLLSNGIRYGGRQLTISCAVVMKAGEKGVETAVSDNGIGIPASAQPHIFDRFYRVDAARGRNGRGLGLAIAHQIIELHGGTLTVESTVGQGSVFRYWLPVGVRD